MDPADQPLFEWVFYCLQAKTQGWTHMPRALRPRIERARVPHSKGSRAQAKAPPAGPNQPLVRSNSGKVALGPWAGPFGTDPPAEDNPVMYMDRTGSGHLSLEGDMVGALAATEEETSDTMSPSNRRLAALVPLTPHVRKARSLEAAALQGKPHPNWGAKANTRLSKKAQFHSQVRMITQPRRSY
eukprot:evm.model.scf_2730.2 EVM.evm.TU.scf_2730.2   scf_2730:17479-19061(-)